MNRRLKFLFRRAAFCISKHPLIKGLLLRILECFPGIKARLFMVLMGSTLTHEGAAANVPKDLAGLSPIGRRVYADLKAALAKNGKENG